MATAPFSLNLAIPGDSDIVSQFPAVDRTHLDIINSWMKVNHNLSGTHNYATFLQVDVADAGGVVAGAPSTVTSSSSVYRDTDGSLKVKLADGTVEFLNGVAPGLITFTAGAVPNGWLTCYGVAVSRSTYARLFTAIGTTFGVGDGSTTFNLPDISNRYIIGYDGGSTGRASNLGASTMGLTGGAQSITVGQVNLPVASFTVTDPGHIHAVTDPAHTHNVTDPTHRHTITSPIATQTLNYAPGGSSLDVWATSGTTNPVLSLNSTGVSNQNATTGISIVAHTTGITVTSGGSGTALTTLPPTITLVPIIRF